MLTTLNSFIKRSVSRSLRWQADSVLVGRLFSLAQGLGRNEEVSPRGAVSVSPCLLGPLNEGPSTRQGLGLAACAVREQHIEDVPSRFSVSFEFFSEARAVWRCVVLSLHASRLRCSRGGVRFGHVF